MPKKSEAQKSALVAGRAIVAQNKLAEKDAQSIFAAALDKARTQLEITWAELQASIEKSAELYRTVRVEL
jgi:hypothetical protein